MRIVDKRIVLSSWISASCDRGRNYLWPRLLHISPSRFQPLGERARLSKVLQWDGNFLPQYAHVATGAALVQVRRIERFSGSRSIAISLDELPAGGRQLTQ